MSIATYTFLPWLRRGIANQIETPAAAGASRAQVVVTLAVASDQARKDLPPVTVQLVGPGDITGLQGRQVIRTEPRAGVTDFEANYLAAIDFYDEDFPWRYSPVTPDRQAHRLPPWIILVILKDAEFTRNNTPGRPLTSFILTSVTHPPDIFPVIGQEWAWAHVHLNATLGGTTSAPDRAQLGSILAANPDLGYARLLSPRKLDPNCSYTAFLVPAFEVGRKAGLGEPVADTDDGTVRSWSNAATEFPIYFEWSFRTGVDGDFESLVRALVPRDMDPRVGIRDMDIAHPGFGLANASNPPDNQVGLEGALLAPTTVPKGLAPTNDFVSQITPVLNAPADVRADGNADPIVTPPIYGCWHAQVERVSGSAADIGSWVNALNLDPRYRAAAGLGARVIRANQENYMRTAWDQIGEVIAVNQKIRRAQLATKAAFAVYVKSFATLAPVRAVTLAAPTFSKILGSPTTLAALLKGSVLPRSAISPALRKQLRPRGRLARKAFGPENRSSATVALVNGINAGKLSAAPPRPPDGGTTLEQVNDAIDRASPPPPPPPPPPGIPGKCSFLKKHPWFLWVVLATILVVFLIRPMLGMLATLAGIVILVWAMRETDEPIPVPPPPPPSPTPPPPSSITTRLLSAAGMSPAAVAATPARSAFTFTSASTDATLPPSAAGVSARILVPGDNAAAADMRRALIGLGDDLSIHITPLPPRPALDLNLVHQKVLAALEPHRAIAARFAPLFRIGGVDALTYVRTHYIPPASGAPIETLQEVMNYPDIKDAMYAPLEDISSEYFLPNLKLIPNNTISLLKTNQPFIESYLAGLNHEFARELLWREYPTDQRGSYFRQFWDVSGYVDRTGRTPKQLAEDLKDVPPLHRWTRPSALGSHNQRDAQGDKSQVVLVIRGDLLKRYPNTFIYAQKATWGTGARANRLILSDETGELFSTAPADPRLRFPLYKARVDPDVHFVGFDLTLEEVRGDPRLDETAAARAVVGDNLGWIFVLQEAVGEPRFGLDTDVPIEPSPQKWDNLAWVNLDLAAGQAVDVAKPLLSAPAGANPSGVEWGTTASDMAYILYQEPVMVAVHGRNMLKNLAPTS